MTREERILAQREQITYWLEYFKDNKMEHGDLELQNRLKEFITSMLGMQLEEMGISLDDVDVEIETDTVGSINGSYTHNTFVRDGELIREQKPLYGFNLANSLEKLENDEPKDRLEAIRDLSRTIFHESRHHRQRLMIEKNISSKESIMYARECLLCDTLGQEFYAQNYSDLIIEADAEKVAVEEYLSVIEDKEFAKLITLNKMRISTGVYSWGFDYIDERECLGLFAENHCFVEGKKTEFLIKYPILQKFYNMDGSRKSSIDLIKNMNLELQALSDTTQLTLEEKTKMLKECKEMYYDQICQVLTIESPEQLQQLSEVGEEEIKNLFEDMSSYFQHELEDKVEIIEEYTKVCVDYPVNEKGRVIGYKNGTKVSISIEGGIKTFDFDNMRKKCLVFANNNLEVTVEEVEELVKKYIIQYIPESGYVISYNNGQQTVKEFVEFALENLVYAKSYWPEPDYSLVMSVFLEKAIMPTKWIKYAEEKVKIEKYYGKKQETLSKLMQELFEQEKNIEEPSDVLKSAVSATEGKTRTGEINQQFQCMMDLEENKDKEQEKGKNRTLGGVKNVHIGSYETSIFGNR